MSQEGQKSETDRLKYIVSLRPATECRITACLQTNKREQLESFLLGPQRGRRQARIFQQLLTSVCQEKDEEKTRNFVNANRRLLCTSPGSCCFAWIVGDNHTTSLCGKYCYSFHSTEGTTEAQRLNHQPSVTQR